MVVAMVSIQTNNIQYNYTTWQVVEEYLPRQLLMDYRKTFKCFDPKKTGVLRMEDVTLILREIGYSVSVNELDHVLRNIIGADCKKTPVRVVDFQEFIALMSVVVTNCIAEDEMHLVFRQFDMDGDGYITADELRNMLSRLGDDITDDELTKMIKAADRDGDGKVSYQEFVRVMTNSGDSCSDSEKSGSPAPSTSSLTETDENTNNVIDEVFDSQNDETQSSQCELPKSDVISDNFGIRHVKHRRSWFSKLSTNKKSSVHQKKKLEGRLSCPALINSSRTNEIFSSEKRNEREKALSSSHGGSSFRLSGFRRKNKKMSR